MWLTGASEYFRLPILIYEPTFQLASQLRATESESLAVQRDTYVTSRGEEPREPRTDLQTLEQEGGVDKYATEL